VAVDELALLGNTMAAIPKDIYDRAHKLHNEKRFTGGVGKKGEATIMVLAGHGV